MFLLHVDISENVFYFFIFLFSKRVKKFEDYNEIRSLDGIKGTRERAGSGYVQRGRVDCAYPCAFLKINFL